MAYHYALSKHAWGLGGFKAQDGLEMFVAPSACAAGRNRGHGLGQASALMLMGLRVMLRAPACRPPPPPPMASPPNVGASCSPQERPLATSVKFGLEVWSVDCEVGPREVGESML